MLLLPSKQSVLLKRLVNMYLAVPAWTQSLLLYRGCCKAPELPLNKDLTRTPVPSAFPDRQKEFLGAGFEGSILRDGEQ